MPEVVGQFCTLVSLGLFVGMLFLSVAGIVVLVTAGLWETWRTYGRRS